MKMFRHGEVIDEFVGLKPEDSIREWIKGNL
jgi:thioredoxin-like negative regulator of GroEL